MQLTNIVPSLRGNTSNWIAMHRMGRTTTYLFDQIYGDVQRAIEFLRGCGVQPGMRVGVLADNSYEWIVLDLATLELKCRLVAFPEAFAADDVDQLAEQYELALLFVNKPSADRAWICELPNLGKNATDQKKKRK